jgi:SWI/SNF-related matrix-associated actin-dependent regulator of chromatin subfamily A3
VNQLAQYDIVITTYNSVAEDRKASKNRPHAATPQTLLSVHWHRVVLDEAHMIRSKSTANARAVRALEADHRWAVTGTPIQNRLTDFANLLAFLRVHPFDNAKYFESEISQPWKVEMNESSLRRLQILAATLCLRRPKAVVELTASFPIQVPVVLQPEERESYEAVRAVTLDFIDHELNASGPRKAAYFSAFQRINDLRYVCNHGTAPKRDKTKLNIDPDKGISKGGLSFAQQLDQFLGAPALICLVCGSDLGDSAGTDSLDVCYQERGPITQQQVCKGCVATSLQIESPSTDSELAIPGSDDAARSVPTRTASSKVRALMTYIERTPRDDKCVVFSYWTASLDLIQSAFEGSGISYSRYDGSLSRNRRDAVLVDFAKDPSIKVILISITCGGQGLDVTIANHAILLEPQWNPMLEEQALSRVHRIGQVKPVYLVRLVVQESFEENIVSLQERKRTLAGLVVDQQKLKAADGKKLLLHLRELVG